MNDKLDPKTQVAATLGADSGIVEVYPLDADRAGYMLGVRPTVGNGAFVHLRAEEGQVVGTLLQQPPPFDAFNDDHITAEVVINAMRFALGAQADLGQRMKVVETLLECAPETTNDHGLELIRRMIVEGTLAVQVVS
jgi:hypothetical protein